MARPTKPSTSPKPAHPDAVDAAVGATLRQLRRARGVSQSALGRHLGVSFQQIQKYECGANRMGASALYRIAALLEVGIGDLFVAAPRRSRTADSPLRDGKVMTVTLPASARAPGVSEEELVTAMADYQKIADASLRAAIRQLIKRLAVEPRSAP